MKKIVVVLGTAALVGGIALGFGRPWYRTLRQERSMALARRFLQKEDLTNALLAVRQTLLVNPSNTDACRTLAQLAEQANAPGALIWRQRLAEADPNLTNRLALAACALRFEPPPFALARRTLESTRDRAESLPSYHQLFAQLALQLGQTDQAENHLRRAAELEPEQPIHRLNLAVLHLGSTNQELQAEARRHLEQAGTNQALRVPAWRSLISESRSRGDWPRAERLSRELLASTNAIFSDHLVHLSLLREISSETCQRHLQQLQAAATQDPFQTAALLDWMRQAGLAAAGLSWSATLANPTRSHPAVRVARAECFDAQRDWNGLTIELEGPGWSSLDFLRLAWLARARYELGELTSSRIHWRQALRLAASNEPGTAQLTRMAATWGWSAETEELLWALLDRFPGQRWAGPALERFYYGTGNTRGLQRVWARRLLSAPDDSLLRNNLTMCNLLLRSDEMSAHARARQLYLANPKHPSYVSTYAFSLFRQDQPEAALRAMEALDPQLLRTPSLQSYLGVFLAANGKVQQAFPLLAAVDQSHLLPEERALVEDALRRAKAY